MAEIQLTPAQQAVVEQTGGALLVSAAAGSGKTKVLVDRLMKQILDPIHPANIDDFLIITYTTAAAAELRTKISKEISARLADDPENRHLQRQSVRIHMAQISTVHAFCSSILREWFHACDLPADFHVAEEQENLKISQEVLGEVLEQCYQKLPEDGDLHAMVDMIGFGRDDRKLTEVLTSVYEKASCSPDPQGWLEQCERACSVEGITAAEQTPWGAYLLERFREDARISCRLLEQAIALAEDDTQLCDKYVPPMQTNLQTIRELAQQTTWDGVCEHSTLKLAKMNPVRSVQNAELKQRVSDLSKEALERIKKSQAAFYAPSCTVLSELRLAAAPIRGIVRVLREYDRRFTAEKRRRKLLDYSDLEHEAIRLLTDRATGKPSACAKEIASRYREIMVDEYQDSNAVQECIFEAVSQNGKNRFMVGDVKQSIYRFRLADPTIFIRKYEQYPSYTEAAEGEGRKILLSENFRSRAEVLQAVNDVFSLVMCKKAGELDYTDAEALKNGNKTFLPTPQPKIELHAISVPRSSQNSDENELKPEKAQIEAEFVAKRIRRLLDDQTMICDRDGLRPAQPKDIVILLRSPGSTAGYYGAALRKHGIAFVTERGTPAIASTEVETARALLSVADNPHQDIPLLTALASPVFAFSTDLLAGIRIGAYEQGKDLYTCLRQNAAKHPQYEAFLSWLSQIRESAKKLPLRQLLGEIFRTTEIENIYAAMPDGAQRLQNLQRLKRCAADYEQTVGGSLGQFCRYLQNLAESGKDFSRLPGGGAVNAVEIASIHHSKGLEYPIVVLADLCKQFNHSDESEQLLLDQELLIGTEVVNTEQQYRYPTISKLAIADKLKRQSVSEEMRLLYVAMTRAREMLIMTCASSYMDSTLNRLNAALSLPLRPEVAAGANCMADWVLLAALCRTEAGELFAQCGGNDCSSVRDDPWVIRYYRAQTLGADAKSERQAEKTHTPFAEPIFKTKPYAYCEAGKIPSKLTATELKGRDLDMEAAEETVQIVHGQWRKPQFSEKTELSGRERGNATHLFMQYVRYECCTSAEGVAAEKERMLTQHFLTPQQAQAVDDAWVLQLFSGDFGKRILAAQNVIREFKFSLFTDAVEYFPNAKGESVMLQGVVDCFWIEDGQLVIVDFKTDRIFGDLEQKTENYRPQLTAYAKALGRIYGLPVRETILYFFDAGSSVRV